MVQHSRAVRTHQRLFDRTSEEGTEEQLVCVIAGSFVLCAGAKTSPGPVSLRQFWLLLKDLSACCLI